jgi:hypothetical protein
MKMDFKKIAILGCVLWTLIFAAKVGASPWIESGDTRLRHHITLLADAGIITVPINTWPLMWSAVIKDVKRGESRKNLSKVEQHSLNYIRDAFTQQTQPSRAALSFSASERPNQLRGFSNVPREEAELSASYEGMQGGTAYKLQATYAGDPSDQDNVRLDGSYAALLIGNWALAAGAIDRWWGPSRQNALVLSNNARPVPGLFLQRNNSHAFDNPLLSWMGPWSLVMFAGQLESDRFVEHAKLLGARFSVRPADWLELGASRTAQWGGEGRPQDFSSFVDVVTGNDNTGDGGITRDNEPSNQLAGIDWRASASFDETSYEFYGDVVGDDNAGVMPSRLIATFGLGTQMPIASTDVRVYLEYTDTQTRRFYKAGQPNYAYEHGTYRSGYRYKDRNIAATIDGDSKSTSLGVEIYTRSDAALQIVLSKLDFNSDGTSKAVGVSRLADRNGEGWQAKINYIENWKNWGFGYGLYYQGGDFELRNMGQDTAGVEFSASLGF